MKNEFNALNFAFWSLVTVRTTLLQGSVKVGVDQGNTKSYQLLAPGQQALTSGEHLNIQKEPMRNVFKIVEKQTGITIFYNEDHIKHAHAVTINAQQMPLADFLTAILKPEKLSFEIKQDNVVVMRKGTTEEKKRL